MFFLDHFDGLYGGRRASPKRQYEGLSQVPELRLRLSPDLAPHAVDDREFDGVEVGVPRCCSLDNAGP